LFRKKLKERGIICKENGITYYRSIWTTEVESSNKWPSVLSAVGAAQDGDNVQTFALRSLRH
jgi:hypothetical protein